MNDPTDNPTPTCPECVKLVLKRAEGVTETVARSQVEEVRSTGQSLMPEGLEQGLVPQDFADLISFIRQIGSK